MKLISLTKGLFAKVDDEDFEYLNQWKWLATIVNGDINKYYASRTDRKSGKKTHILMHRLLMNPPEDLVVDHIDGDRSNNQKANLRICTRLENNRNRPGWKDSASKFKGVSWQTRKKKWAARILVDRVQVFIGLYEQERDAALAYNHAAQKHHGEFASLNIIP